MGQVSQLSRAQGVGAKRWDVGNVKPQICLWIVHSVGACVIARIQSMTSLVLVQVTISRQCRKIRTGQGKWSSYKLRGKVALWGTLLEGLFASCFPLMN